MEIVNETRPAAECTEDTRSVETYPFPPSESLLTNVQRRGTDRHGGSLIQYEASNLGYHGHPLPVPCRELASCGRATSHHMVAFSDMNVLSESAHNQTRCVT